MSSPTSRTTLRRKRRDSRKGNTRKAKLRSQGSTKSKAKLFGDDE